MSHRFPPIAAQSDLNRTRARALVRTMPQVPGLPWLELALGFALLILLRGF